MRRIGAGLHSDLCFVPAVADAGEEQDAGAAARHGEDPLGTGTIWLEGDDVLHAAVLDEVDAVTMAEATRIRAERRHEDPAWKIRHLARFRREPRSRIGRRSSLPLTPIRTAEG